MNASQPSMVSCAKGRSGGKRRLRCNPARAAPGAAEQGGKWPIKPGLLTWFSAVSRSFMPSLRISSCCGKKGGGIAGSCLHQEAQGTAGLVGWHRVPQQRTPAGRLRRSSRRRAHLLPQRRAVLALPRRLHRRPARQRGSAAAASGGRAAAGAVGCVHGGILRPRALAWAGQAAHVRERLSASRIDR